MWRCMSLCVCVCVCECMCVCVCMIRHGNLLTNQALHSIYSTSNFIHEDVNNSQKKVRRSSHLPGTVVHSITLLGKSMAVIHP